MFAGVVLIGGSASVGKTMLAALLAERLAGAQVIHVDKLRRDDPDVVHYLDRPEVWDSEPRALLGLLLEETASLRPALFRLISRARDADGPVIVEGEGIEPGLIERFAGDALVRALYVVEPCPGALRHTFSSRPSGAHFLALPGQRREAVVEMNRLYGTWLLDEATGHGHTWVSSQPWATLPDRAAAALALP